MRLLTGLFRMARKRLQTADGDGTFREKVSELVERRDSLSEEGVNQAVDELDAQIADLPDGEDKDKLGRFLEDFRGIKEQDAETAKEAGAMISDLFERLDGAAMADSVEPPAEGKGAGEEEAEQAVAETVPPDTGDEAPPEGKDGEKSVADGEDDEMERFYQYVKKRWAEDGCKDGETPPEDKDEPKPMATDGAPRITVQMGGRSRGGTLAKMVQDMKNGGR